MYKSLVVLAGLVLLLPFAAAQDAEKTKEAAANYWPLKAGTKWHFQADIGGKQIPVVLQVAKIETIDGQQLPRLESLIQGNVTASEHLSSSDKGIFRHRYNGIEVSPPVCLLKAGAKAGDSWEIDCKIGNDTLKGTCKLGTDQVTVPAGKYKTITILLDAETGGGVKVKTTYWLAPDVGMVKQTVDILGKTILLELEKFEPGK